MANTEELLVRIDATTEQLRREMRRADQAIDKSTKGMRRDLSRVDRAVAGLNAKFSGFARTLGGFGVGLGAGVLGRFGRNAIRTAADVERMSEAIGISGETLQELSFAFEQFDLKQDDVTDALATLSDRAQDAASGTKSMQEDFALVGLSVDDLRGKRPDELFRLFAEAVANTEDPSARTAAVVRTLGDDLGRRLLPLLRRGEDGLDDLASAARRSGAVMEDETLKSAEELDRQFSELTSTLSTLAKTITVEVAAAIQNLGEQLGTGFAQLTTGRTLPDELEHLERRLETLRAQRENIPDNFFSFLFAGDRLDEEISEVERQLSRVRRTMGQDLFGLSGRADNAIRNAGSVQVDPISVRASPPSLDFGLAQRVVDFNRQRNQRTLDEFDTTERRIPNFDPETGFQILSPDELQRAQDTADEFDRLGDGVMDVERASQDLGFTFSSAFEDAIIQGENLRGIMQGLLEDIQRIILRTTVTEPLGNALAGGLTGLFSGGGGGDPLAAGNAVPRANGGPVGPGTTYLVGERGPELFSPSRSGMITPNSAMGGDTIAITQNFDLRGADESSVNRLRAEASRIKAETIAEIRNRQQRRGSSRV